MGRSIIATTAERGILRPGESIILLGNGWFPDQPGGLNRYLRGLLGALDDHVSARAIVLGPASDASSDVVVPADRSDPLGVRLRRFAAAAGDAAEGACVVDAHFALYAFVPVVLGGMRRLPLVLHFHGPWADESWAAGEHSWARRHVKRSLERLVHRRAIEVVTLSGAFKRIAIERYSAVPWHVSVIPPGVDTVRFSPGDSVEARRTLGINPEVFVVVCVRRLVPRMGIDVLLEALSQLSQENRDLALIIAGDGPERRSLEERASGLGLEETVRFLGGTSEETLLACYRAADVCVVPSAALEGFGLVVLEALACGTPVIGTDIGGLPEALAPLDESLIVPREPEALATRLRQVLDGSKPLPSEGECRTYAERFTWDGVGRTHAALYARALSPKPPDGFRVVFLDHCAALSGAELALLRLIPTLEGIQAHVILAEEGPLVDRLLRAGISVEVLPMHQAVRALRRERITIGGVRSSAALSTGAYVVRLARRLRRMRPDLVHANSLKSALYGGLAARLAGVPIVWHLRDRIAEDYLPSAAVRLVRGAARHLPDAIIANSRTTLAALAEAGGPLPRHLAVVRSTVLPTTFGERQSNGAPNGQEPLCFGMVGRIAPWKGQHVFLEAFARAFPCGDVRARVVGAPLFGEDAYDQDLRRLAVDLRIADRVEFTGFREDVARELGSLDVLVHGSVIPEPFGQVVAEGLAAGLPVVAAAAGGPSELVESGVNGVLYPPGDVPALEVVLRELASDPELRVRLATAARTSARRFLSENVAEEVLRVYRSVVASSHG